jgi:hypothetical protein
MSSKTIGPFEELLLLSSVVFRLRCNSLSLVSELLFSLKVESFGLLLIVDSFEVLLELSEFEAESEGGFGGGGG